MEQLRDNLRESGGIDPAISKILLWQPDANKNDAVVIEGHNRWNICLEEGFELTTDCFDFSEPFEDEDAVIRWIEDNQLGRRNLSKYARFEIIYRREGEDLEAAAKERKTANLKQGPESSHGNHREKGSESMSVKDTLAARVGVAPKTIINYRKIYNSDTEEVKRAFRLDQISITKALERIAPQAPVKRNITAAGTVQSLDHEQTGRQTDGSTMLPTEEMSGAADVGPHMQKEDGGISVAKTDDLLREELARTREQLEEAINDKAFCEREFKKTVNAYTRIQCETEITLKSIRDQLAPFGLTITQDNIVERIDDAAPGPAGNDDEIGLVLAEENTVNDKVTANDDPNKGAARDDATPDPADRSPEDRALIKKIRTEYRKLALKEDKDRLKKRQQTESWKRSVIVSCSRWMR